MKNLRLAALIGAAALPLAATAQATPAASTAPAAQTAPADPAAAPATPEVAAGTVVYDSQGVEIGKIESVTGDSVVLAVGENRATLNKSAFGTGAKGVSLNTTKAQVEAAIAEAAAKSGAMPAASPSPAG